MSKFGWISDMTEHYLNKAVEERVLRWTALRHNWTSESTKTQNEDQLLQYVQRFRNGQGPGHEDKTFQDLLRRIAQEKSGNSLEPGAKYTKAQLIKSQAHRYRGTYYLRLAIHHFQHQNVQDMQGMQPRSLYGHRRMLKKAGDVKRFMKEIQRRYEVVDRTYFAVVTRKNGRLDRVAK